MTQFNSIIQKPLINEEGVICHFGQCLEAEKNNSLFDITPEALRTLVDEHQLLVLRGFSPLESPEQLTEFCQKIGNIMMWPFGPILELVEDPNATDHIFASSYVPLHWDGMYLETVPELQIFHCVSSVDSSSGGRTTFSSTPAALKLADSETYALWQRAIGEYTRSVELYSSTARAPIIEDHPYRPYQVIRFCESPHADDKDFLNPSAYAFLNIDESEKATLLSSLEKALYDPRVHYAHQWQDGDIVIADNYTLLHGREAFTSQSGRHLRRVHLHAHSPLSNPHLVKA